MIKIIIADEIDLSGVRLLKPPRYKINKDFGISNSRLITDYADYEVLLIRSVRKIDKKFLEKTNFKIIATCSKGKDHIDVLYAEKKGIRILNADDSNNISAAEHTLALILAIEKKIIFSDKLVRKNKFTYYDYERNELYGKSIGIIGFGKVGSYVGKLCKAFGMEVYANDIDNTVRLKNKNFRFKSLDFIMKNCDIITIHIPLNKKNYRFFSETELKKLNTKTILINTSRGDVIDEKYLIKILKENKIKYAGLDVFSREPNIDKGFSVLDNTVLTNHIAGKTTESKKRISENIFQQLKNIYG